MICTTTVKPISKKLFCRLIYWITYTSIRPVASGGPLVFGRAINPISTRRGKANYPPPPDFRPCDGPVCTSFELL